MILQKTRGLRVLITAFFCAAISVIGHAQTPDPGLPGPYTVAKAEYNFGDTVVLLPDYPAKVEVIGSVHYPTPLTGGPYPVLFFLHGRHSTCYDTTNTNNTSSDWPCGGTYVPITSYEGYDYLATQMASHGYIVISVSCNAINAGDDTVGDAGMQGRGELLQYHMRLWDTINTYGRAPFDTMFRGKLDMQNVGTMGHSRGGEGVIFNALYNRSLGNPFGIKAVLTLAPVDFWRHVLNGIPLLDVSPYCDGDVNDIEGVHFYDDSRYIDTADETPKHTVLFMGANHNYFNTVWTPYCYPAGGIDDWLYGFSCFDPHCGTCATGNGRFDTTTQKAAFNAYASAFFRLYIGHENTYAPILNVDMIAPPASSTLDTSQVFVSCHPGTAYRLDINRTDSTVRTTTNTLNSAVTDSGLTLAEICSGGFSMADCNVSIFGAQEPHTGSSTTPGLAEMNMRWNDTLDWYENAIPVTKKDFSSYKGLQFRASVNFNLTTTHEALNFTVELQDSTGAKSDLKVGNYSQALFYQPGTQSTDLPKVLFNTVKIPLNDFTGVDLTKVAAIKFRYNAMAEGAVIVSDIAAVKSPCGKYAAFDDSVGLRYHVIFSNTTVAGEGDSLSYLWNFGDSTATVTDTSSAVNPSHAYPGPGTYNACLYVTSYQANGYICTDTFCHSFALVSDGVKTILQSGIVISPNPAKDHFKVTGSVPGDMLTLVNMYGQTVLTADLANSNISLPSLPTGVYCAIVTTANGMVYQKLVVEH